MQIATIYLSPITLPGGTAQLRLQANCPDFDSGAVKSKGGQLTVQAPCPPVTVNADSIIRNSAAYKAALIGRGLADMRADSLKASNKSLTDQLSKTRKDFFWLGVSCLGLMVWTFRSPIISLLKKIFA